MTRRGLVGKHNPPWEALHLRALEQLFRGHGQMVAIEHNQPREGHDSFLLATVERMLRAILASHHDFLKACHTEDQTEQRLLQAVGPLPKLLLHGQLQEMTARLLLPLFLLAELLEGGTLDKFVQRPFFRDRLLHSSACHNLPLHLWAVYQLVKHCGCAR